MNGGLQATRVCARADLRCLHRGGGIKADTNRYRSGFRLTDQDFYERHQLLTKGRLARSADSQDELPRAERSDVRVYQHSARE